MHERLFTVKVSEEVVTKLDITTESLYRYLTTNEFACPGVKITVIETPEQEREFVNCSKCKRPLNVIRHTIKDFVCCDCS